MASGPQLHCWRVSRARAAASGTDGKDSSELRQGRQSKPHSPCRAGPFPSKKKTPPNAWLLPPTGTACAWLRGRQVRSRSPIGTGAALAHAFYAREPRAPPPRRHIFRVPAPPAADSVPDTAMGADSAGATSEPLHRLQPLLLARTELTSGDPNHTRPAPTARSATPGRGCHRPPRPTFAVTVQEHLNSTQDHQKVCTSTPSLSSELGGELWL